MGKSHGPRGRAIVTFSRSWQALAAIRSLGTRGVEVVSADEISLTPGNLSCYSHDSFVYPNPDAEPEAFLDALEEAVERFRPAEGVPYVLMPVHRETYPIARQRARLEGRIAFALPPPGVIDRVRDKGGLFQAIASNVDYPWMLFELALGRRVAPPVEIDTEVTTEAPVLGLLATLREAAESASRWSSLEQAWEKTKDHLGRGELQAGIDSLLRGLREGLDGEGRLEAMRRLLDERQNTVSQLFAGGDPRAAIGLLYPLAIFLRQGRVTAGTMAGAEPAGGGPGGGEK